MISALASFSLGATEMIILLVIILILFGGARLPKLMQGMQQGIHSFKSGMQQDELWQFIDGRQRQISQPPKPEHRQLGFTLILGAALLLIMAASIAGVISVPQALAALGVIAVVGLTWWLLFGRTRH